RACLELFKRNDCRILIITKSDLILRDIGLLKDIKTAVTFTVTTLNEKIAKKLEPNAPKPIDRLKTASKLAKEGIPVGVRLDPIIPSLNDANLESIIKFAKEANIIHLVTSTYKPRPDNWKRLKNAFPEIATKLAPLYFEKGERHHNSWYLPKAIRLSLMKEIKELCAKYNLTFATCREGFPELSTAKSCDGSHLISN
ncbi:MAG: radical SAM protein, partial [Euryarchaeota archaeon]|nr:radical SAM protein [Euryarchaeota archaeon]